MIKTQRIKDCRRGPPPRDAFTRQSLHLRFREKSKKKGKSDKNQCVGMFDARQCLLDVKRNWYISNINQYGCLNKAGVMAVPVDLPVWTGGISQGVPALDEELQAINSCQEVCWVVFRQLDTN